jgi:thiamine pyrophosphate-dependent acetolactate synthase large subunit-like protein
MANAMPNTIGAALAYPGRQAIAICGDGGLSMLMGDLPTIAERELPVKLVGLDNGGFQFAHIEQEEAGIQPFEIKFANPDLAKVAESIGLTGIRVEDPRQVRDAVAEFLATPSRPTPASSTANWARHRARKGRARRGARPARSRRITRVIVRPNRPHRGHPRAS